MLLIDDYGDDDKIGVLLIFLCCINYCMVHLMYPFPWLFIRTINDGRCRVLEE